MPETNFLETAREAARLGGSILKEWAGKFTVSEKGPSDLVTEADLASQEAIYRLIHSRYPGHNVLGEEGLSETNSDGPYRWVIDPLDGTSNYVHGFPYYAVSIGLERSDELVLGVVFDPNRDEMFAAVTGSATTLNGEPIRPTATSELREAMLMASLPVAVQSDDWAVQQFVRALSQAQTVQRTGSAALNLSYVAAGRIDAFWSSSLKPWDMAAGAFLVTASGGRVSAMDGGPLDINVPSILASNGTALHAQLEQLLSSPA